MIRTRFLTGIDWAVIVIPLLLVTAGIAVIYSLSPAKDGQMSLALTQGIYAILGLIIFAAMMSFDFRMFRAVAPILYGISLALLVMVLFVGSVQFGARRWIDLGVFQLQPAELMKMSLLIILAWYFSSREEIKARDLVVALLFIAVPAALLLRQPDFGSAVVMILGTIPIFILSRLRREQWLGIGATLLVALPILVFSLQPYQRERLETFINPTNDPFGAGYNVLQSTIAIGSGGLFGRGLGQGSQSTLQFVPVAHTDFIFAGLAEASGFLGSSILLILFAILIWRAFGLTIATQDRFGRLLAGGIGSLWFFSVVINVGMNLGLLPVTGIPLPFVSYGGSSLLINLALAGILQSISLRKTRISFR